MHLDKLTINTISTEKHEHVSLVKKFFKSPSEIASRMKKVYLALTSYFSRIAESQREFLTRDAYQPPKIVSHLDSKLNDE